MALEVQLIFRDVIRRRYSLDRALEIGRSMLGEIERPGSNRILIAPEEQTTVPRRWFVISPLEDGGVEVRNIHSTHTVRFADCELKIPKEDARRFEPPISLAIQLFDHGLLRIIDTAIHPLAGVQAVDDGLLSGIRSIATKALLAKLDQAEDTDPAQNPPTLNSLVDSRGNIESRKVVSLMRKALQVVEAAAGSDGFLEAAVRAAVEIVGLDRAAILVPAEVPTELSESLHRDPDIGSADDAAPTPVPYLAVNLHDSMAPSLVHGLRADEKRPAVNRQGSGQGGWSHRAEYRGQDASQMDPSRRLEPPSISIPLLQRLIAERTTQVYDPAVDQTQAVIAGVSSIVAAPILDRDGSVAAILYGDRWVSPSVVGKERDYGPINELEGVLLEILAGAVAGGIIRQQEEKSRARLAEFFSPRVAKSLVNNPELLGGRDTEVSVLFCDIRGFSAVAENQHAEQTIQWINEILTELSRCVVEHDGVLVDYVGDELFAMWGAPEHQPDHGKRAFAAAAAMLGSIEPLRKRLESVIHGAIDLGIGINSGPARVGNVGSQLKFKYGVLGHTVNVGSRLQRASKRLGVRCVVSAAAVQASGRRKCARRLANLRLDGIQKPIEVFEFVAEPEPHWSDLRERYELALEDFESARPGQAVHRLGSILQDYPRDRPSEFLLGHAATMLTNPDWGSDTVWSLEPK